MDRFLHGFVDELVKLGQPGVPEPVRSPTTATRPPGGRPAPLPRPSNYAGPTGSYLRAIPTQEMRSPPAIRKKPAWRPSPTYKPKPQAPAAPEAKPAAAKGGGRRSSGRKNLGVPWESGTQMASRSAQEAAYNQRFKQGLPAANLDAIRARSEKVKIKPLAPKPTGPKPSGLAAIKPRSAGRLF